MSSFALATDVVCFWAAAVGVWALLAWFYRDYRIDRFRQNLFALRDELFDLAAGGEVDFDNTAYGLLRMMINGQIRFAHRAGIWYVIGAVRLQERAKADGWSESPSFMDRFAAGKEALTPESRAKLEALHRRVHREIIWHTLLMSPIFDVLLVAAIIPTILFVLCQEASKQLSRRVVLRTAAGLRSTLAPVWNTVDAAAVEIGCIA